MLAGPKLYPTSQFNFFFFSHSWCRLLFFCLFHKIQAKAHFSKTLDTGEIITQVYTQRKCAANHLPSYTTLKAWYELSFWHSHEYQDWKYKFENIWYLMHALSFPLIYYSTYCRHRCSAEALLSSLS